MKEKEKEQKKQWLNSKDTQKALKIRACELMHLREAGELKFKKVGRGYFYEVGEEPLGIK